MLVYKITNKVNGKVYVGQTVRTLEERWSRHCRDAQRGRTFPFHNAIRKYGTENFEMKIVAFCHDQKELNWCEQAHTLNENSMVPDGYNLIFGGDRKAVSAETRAKIGAAHRNPSEKTREKLRKAGKIGGKIQGRKNVESGQLASICSLGGKIGGKAACCLRWNIRRGKPCSCGRHDEATP